MGSVVKFCNGGLNSGTPRDEKEEFGSPSIVLGDTSIICSSTSTSGMELASETAAVVIDLFSAALTTTGA